jgi:hypothetical protein
MKESCSIHSFFKGAKSYKGHVLRPIDQNDWVLVQMHEFYGLNGTDSNEEAADQVFVLSDLLLDIA